jgi:1-deoxy-D-xylulose-5-phosphate synthase
VDGHDVAALTRVLRQLREQSGPRLLHVVTSKGKDLPAAEADPVAYHAVGPKPESTLPDGGQAQPSLSFTLGQWAADKAAEDDRLVCTTPAMAEGSGLSEFAAAFPVRFHYVALQDLSVLSAVDRAGIFCRSAVRTPSITSRIAGRTVVADTPGQGNIQARLRDGDCLRS